MNRSTVSKTWKPIAADYPGRSAAFLHFTASLWLAVFLLSASPSAAFEGGPTTGAHVTAPIDYDRETGLLAGTAEAGADITTILSQIAEAAGFSVNLEPGLGTIRNSLSFNGLPVEDALRKLLSARSFVVVHTGTDEAMPIISEVWVMNSVGSLENEAATGPVIAPASSGEETAEAKEDSPEVLRAIGVREILFLANKGDAASVAELKELALNAENPRLRRAAMSALASTAGRDSHWLFRFDGLQDPDPGVRIEAARSLLRTDSLRGAALVKIAAMREPDADTRDILERLAAGETVAPVAGMDRTTLTK